MRSIAYYWKEGLRNIFKHGFMSVAAVVIMVVSLLLTGTVTLVAYNITNNITRLQQSNQIVVWIDDSLTTREAKTLQTQFEKIDNIASIAFEVRSCTKPCTATAPTSAMCCLTISARRSGIHCSNSLLRRWTI